MLREANIALIAWTDPPSDPWRMTSLMSVSPKRLAIASATVPVEAVAAVCTPPALCDKFGRRHLQKDGVAVEDSSFMVAACEVVSLLDSTFADLL